MKEANDNYYKKFDFSMDYKTWKERWDKQYQEKKERFVKNICSHKGRVQQIKNKKRGKR